ncbi:DNA helicase, putative [Talaromyces stipitatus ATCC 10500]|uniref:DNA helicase, putative n=1 Tax=Talaromyces stipitatus (strain ATCC 10500 / CBS 375.48 / QM 6759 / NRRL 1006) TaxID=441959 RepID=B8M4H1_TALSN|nr:DNA helicase, putative [Talaromyces stipitatus ATCC 10500]EED19166.1 DNA helicase, putative [Talaromyces stipitatus ATCC 10500]
MTTSVQIPLFAAAQRKLLQKEHEAEKLSSALATSSTNTVSPSTRRTLQATGYALTGLVLEQWRTGMGGRIVGEFGADAAFATESTEDTDGRARFGAHGIRVGDVVRVLEISAGRKSGREGKEAEGNKANGAEGVVIKASDKALSVAFGQTGGGANARAEEAVDDLWGKKLWLVKLANDVTHRRLNQTMEKMEKMPESEHTYFMRVLFGHTTPSSPDYDAIGAIEFIDPTLNHSQKEAIRFALASKEIALIHGPPGTGKTHTLIELILQMIRRNMRILVCGPSNVSVDNIVERLAPHRVPIVRVGHPARLLSSVLDHSLEVLTQTSEAAEIVRDVRKEIDEKQASIRKTRNGRERREIYGDLKELRKEFRERESKCVEDLVTGSKVVLATLHGAGGHRLKNQKFDVVIIDEASQALEAQCWIPLLTASRAVLAGDHLQLPPTIKSSNIDSSKKTSKTKVKEAEKSSSLDSLQGVSLGQTMFDRLLALHGPSIKRMLTTQYRMHEKIMQFPSNEMYEGKLIAADSVKDRLLKDLPYGVEDTDDTKEPLVFIDTQGGDFPEKAEDEDATIKGGLLSESKSNEMEARVAIRHVEGLIDAGVRPEDIAVITPYNAQVALIAQCLREKYPGIEIGSVDGFQGREKEAIVVSLVRSNEKHEVGFLGEKRRLNVAMTRPKRHLCVCGDSETISKGSKFLKNWIGFLEEHADLQYPDVSELF